MYAPSNTKRFSSPYSNLTTPSRRTTPARGSGLGGVRAMRSGTTGEDVGGNSPSRSSGPMASLASPLASSYRGFGSSGTPSYLNNGKSTLSVAKSMDSAMMGGLSKGTDNFLVPPVESSWKFLDGEPPKSYVTVVWDLDETLCSNRRAGRALLRPGAIDILKHLRSLSSPTVFVEVILWTASMECVAKPVVQRLDPQGTIFNHLIYRDRRWYKETGYTKDLRRLGRAMDRTVIIENSPLSVQLNRRHSILVKDFMGGPGSTNDTDLYTVKEILTNWIADISRSIEKHLQTLEQPASSPTGSLASNDGGEQSTPLAPPKEAPSLKKSPRPEPSSEPNGFQDVQLTSVGPSIVEFLSHDPHISSGNELISGKFAGGGAVNMGSSALRGASLAPRARFPSLTTPSRTSSVAPQLDTRRTLMYR